MKKLFKRYEIHLIIIGFILLLSWNAGLFKPTNYLSCKHKFKGNFYLKIVQKDFRAYQWERTTDLLVGNETLYH